MISKEAREKAIRLYKHKYLTLKEISNLTGISYATLTGIYKKAFENGTLKPRHEFSALKPRVPNGQGKQWCEIKGVGQGGRSKERKKYSPEEEHQIVIDYYEKNLSVKELKEKWGIHPMQIQRMREQFGHIYGKKKGKGSVPVLQFDKAGNFIAEYPSCLVASQETGVYYSSIVACCNGKIPSAGGFIWDKKAHKKDDD